MYRIRNTLSISFPALASRDFAIFWVGHLLSLIGTAMQNTAQPLLAYRLSGRPFDPGLIGFALALPIFFLALPGGVLIEHWDKRKTIIILQIVMMLEAFVLAYLTLCGMIQIWHIIVWIDLLNNNWKHTSVPSRRPQVGGLTEYERLESPLDVKFWLML